MFTSKKMELKKPEKFQRYLDDKKMPKLNPKSLAIKYLPTIPWHRKHGLSPVFLVSLCCVFMVVLWFLLFTK
jgi:hypothetical protein